MLTCHAGHCPPGCACGQARHRHDAIDAEQTGDADRVAQVVGVLGADLGVGVQRVAVAVQPGDRHPGAVEGGQVLLRRDRAGQQVVDRQMRCGQEPARVDLGAGQSERGDDLQRLAQWLVVQDGGVDTKLHRVELPFWLERL